MTAIKKNKLKLENVKLVVMGAWSYTKKSGEE